MKNIEPENAKKEIEKIYFPAPVLFLAHHIGTEANAIRDEKYWNNLPYSLRYRASVAWHKIFENTTRDPVLFLKSIPSPVSNEAWYKYIKTFNNTDKPRVKGKSLDFIDENSARIGLARQLAASSSSSGFFPKDIAEWRRLAMCSIALEAIIEDRFNALAEDLKPFEPLNTIKISRKLGGDECRVMSLHCAEDLISHQYIMNELLTERHDGWLNKTEDVIFSEHIPVTRFYNESSISITTGEGKDGSLNEEILSFAYQIDMDVVEGRVKSKTSGMFRPYFDCWRDFTFAINHAATQMDKVRSEERRVGKECRL